MTATSGAGPAQSSRYAVVDGRTYPARFVAGGPELLLLVPLGEPQPAGFVRSGEHWVRAAGWDDIERIFEIQVWWRRSDGTAVLEAERDGDRVRVEPAVGGNPYGVAEGPVRGGRGTAATADGWVDVAVLYSRCEVEQEYDVTFFRTPLDELAVPGAPDARSPVVRTTVRPTTPSGTPVPPAGSTVRRHVPDAANALFLVAVLLVVVGIFSEPAKLLIVAGTCVGVVAVVVRYRSIR